MIIVIICKFSIYQNLLRITSYFFLKMSIDPQVLKETDEFISLQEAIFNVTNKNIDETFEICTKFFSQKDIEQRLLIDSFFNAVMSSIHSRPYNHDNVAQICSLVVSLLDGQKMVNYFKDKILSMQIDRFQNFEAIPFLHKCYYHQLFTKDEAISTILKYKYLTTNNLNTILSFFCYFAPIIQYEFPQLYDECLEKLNSKNEKSELPVEFQKFQKKFRFFKQMEWELQHVCSYNCYIPGTIEWAISNDDLKEMENIIKKIDYDAYKYIVNPDDYVLEYEQFHPNKRVSPSVYETSKILLNYPTLIQFAAYHGAVNCFKYLLQVGASPKCIDQVGIGLSQFAAAGGNLEIIQLCAQLNVNFARSCHFAVAYNNFDVMQWMIKHMNVRILNRDDVFGTLLHRAAASNNIRILKFCIDYCTENIKKGVRNSCFDLHQQYLQSKKKQSEKVPLEKIENDEKEDSDSDSSTSSNSISDSDPEFIIVNVVTCRGETPLHAAAAKGNYEAVKLLLGHKLVIPNAIGDDGCTPFYFAVLYNKMDVVELMIKDSRINVNKPDDEGQSPLHIAVKNDYLEIATELLNSPRIQVNSRNINGQTAIHFAAIYDQIEELKLLLDDDRVNKNAQDNLGQTPLFVAIMQNNCKIVQELLNRKDVSITISDELGYSPLHIAVELHQLECERLLLHMDFDQDEMIKNEDLESKETTNDFLKNQKMIRKSINCVDNKGMNAIQIATLNGDFESFLLLQDFINMFHKDNQGNTIINIAAQYGQSELLSYFYNLQIFDFTQKNNLGRNPFHSSILSPNFDTFLFFLRNQKELNCEDSIYDVDNNKMSALSLAVKYQKIEIIDYLLHKVGGFNINEQNNSKQTPLHIAAKLSDHNIIDILLKEEKIDINILDENKDTPLLICIANEDEEDALILLERHDCITNIQNNKGWTPLHFAASIGNIKLLKKILNKKDAPIDKLNKDEDTPLDIAIQNKHKEAEEFLIFKSSKENLGVKDKSGKSAYDYAVETNQNDIAELINNKINSPISSFFHSIPKITSFMIKH